MGTMGDLLHTHRAEILRAWTEAAENAASAKGLTSPELASMMPAYLSLLGEAGEPARLTVAQQALIERHLTNRLREGFSLNEILTEFAVLGRCVSRIMENVSADEHPSVAEVARLYAELYQTSTAVTQIFNEHLLEDEQTMKRYSRLLKHIADDPIDRGDRSWSLRERLEEVLALIREATGARVAALLLGDDLNAASGTGAAELEEWALSLETALAGRIDSGGREADAVQVSAALRRCGVASLLRLKLSVPEAPRSVLYVGIADDRSFSASEIRRLEGLGGALTIHLDNARLRAVLRRKEDELRAERELRERVVSVLIREVRGPLAAVRSSVRRLVSEPADVAAGATEMVDTLARIQGVVDAFLTTTPAMSHGER